MKKFIAIMLMILIVVSLCNGCANTQGNDKTTTEDKSTSSKEATLTTSTQEEPVELTILAAASLTDATAKIAKLYKKVAPNVTLTFSYGASGALQAQIEEGAPGDIFISAATKQMKELEENGLLLANTKKDLLSNKLVLIVPKDSTLGLTSFEDLGEDLVKTVAQGEPNGVPVGQYSEQVFSSLGILDIVKGKTNYGSDVKQVLTWVESGEVDCGVVYSTDAIMSDKISVICEAPEGSHEDIIYPAAVLGSSASQDAAKAFLEYLSSDEAAAVFEEFGFNTK